MAWNKTHKAQSKDKILQSAALLFTHQGFEQVSIDQVMEKAKMTRGAFYSHFSSKSDLYAQALAKASKVAQQRISTNTRNDLQQLALSYLSVQHINDITEQACPLAFLVSDINQQDATVRAAYTDIFEKFIQQTQDLTQDRQLAIQNSVMMIGGLAIARAIENNDFSDEILQACQCAVKASPINKKQCAKEKEEGDI